MKILLIEDDYHKYIDISNLIEKTLDFFEVVRKDNVHDAINYLQTDSPEKIILDMSLPSHALRAGEGNPLPMNAGGMEVIMELRILRKEKIPIFIITQYPDIVIENEYYPLNMAATKIKDFYGIRSLEVFGFEKDSKEWEEILQLFLRS